MMVHTVLKWLGKASVVYLALIAASVFGGLVFYQGVGPIEGFDAGATQRTLFVVNASYALMLAALASRTGLSRPRSAFLMFALMFCVQTLLSQMEALYFADSLDYSWSHVPRDAGAGVLSAMVGAGTAALVFGAGPRESAYTRWPVPALARRFALATALYPVAYWTAGLLIALQSEALRDFYGAGLDLDPAPLLAFQILRGAIWAALALAAAHGLRGSRISKAILTGAAFAVFMAAQLLIPNPLMPETVRMVHFVEILVSNSIYGFVATFLLAPRRAVAAAIH